MEKKESLLDIVLERILDIADGSYEPNDYSLQHLKLYYGLLQRADLSDIDRERASMALNRAHERVDSSHTLGKVYLSNLGAEPLSKETVLPATPKDLGNPKNNRFSKRFRIL